MTVYPTLSQLQGLVGRELGVSEWLVVDQSRIDRFADATDDHQWIHVDHERARQGPFGSTIAHGYLTLSLLPRFFDSAFEIGGLAMSVNYGLNRVRFPAPVPVNSRLRARFKLLAYDPLDGGAQLVVEATIERDGGERPVCVAETVSRRYDARRIEE
jgi:acyl dehydratase